MSFDDDDEIDAPPTSSAEFLKNADHGKQEAKQKALQKGSASLKRDMLKQSLRPVQDVTRQSKAPQNDPQTNKEDEGSTPHWATKSSMQEAKMLESAGTSSQEQNPDIEDAIDKNVQALQQQTIERQGDAE